ncbi:MAG: carboxy-S-adenosyl-L-methionine synthase CmoA [Deltaproteobacteria bacterium]|nr:MAG: carboxy-S-adenosyl-L-methionine synthase CmoA [Deltaproteobacteria bacterium]
MKRDKVFAEKKDRIEPFAFNREVTAVFDDMLNRSVPLYKESIQRQAQMALAFFQEKTRIYDLGCSHGNLGILIAEQFYDTPFAMVGVDSSYPMIEKYHDRLAKIEKSHQIDLVCGLLEDLQIENASVVLINLTLQFLELSKRNKLIKKIYQGLLPGGILLVTEKIIHPYHAINALEQDFYRRFKRENGYSELEISQKRDALEKVLIPEAIGVHRQRFFDAGFSSFDVWLKWFNFASMIAIK